MKQSGGILAMKESVAFDGGSITVRHGEDVQVERRRWPASPFCCDIRICATDPAFAAKKASDLGFAVAVREQKTIIDMMDRYNIRLVIEPEEDRS
jgi:hypothetical protein